jgi:hypothetical protein
VLSAREREGDRSPPSGEAAAGFGMNVGTEVGLGGRGDRALCILTRKLFGREKEGGRSRFFQPNHARPCSLAKSPAQ